MSRMSDPKRGPRHDQDAGESALPGDTVTVTAVDTHGQMHTYEVKLGELNVNFNVYLDARLHVATALIGTLVAAGQLLAVVAALAMPLLAARWGTGRTFVVASAGMALCLLPLALIHHWAAAGFGFMGMIALASITRPAINVYQMETVVEGWRPAMSGTPPLRHRTP